MFRGSHLGDLTEPLTGRSWQHDELCRRVIARIGYYGEQGVSQCDRVFVLYGNNLEFRRSPGG